MSQKIKMMYLIETYLLIFNVSELSKRSLFMTRGDRVQMTFYKNFFRGPLIARWKTFAAH